MLFLFNDLVRQRKHVGRKREADVFGRLQVDDELKLRSAADNRLTDLFHGARLKNI